MGFDDGNCAVLQSEGVTVFTIGVGFINLQELLAVASPPVCTHVYVLDNYAHIDSILYEIQKSTCEGNYEYPIRRKVCSSQYIFNEAQRSTCEGN